MRNFFTSGSTSRIVARFFSISSPFSAMLDAEPTVTNSVFPSGFATTLRVQWLPPPGRSTTFSAVAVMRVWPTRNGKRTSASVLAT